MTALPSGAPVGTPVGGPNAGPNVPLVPVQPPSAASALLNAARMGGEAIPRHSLAYGNNTRLLRDNAEFAPALLDDARKFQRIANIAEFNWDPDGIGREFADVLIDRLRKGRAEGKPVQVNATIDAFGTYQHVPFSKHRRFVKELRREGVNVKTNWKMPFVNDGNRWDHRKLFNFDGKVGYVGGMGLGHKYNNFHDFMLRFEGPAVAQAQAEFLGRFVDLGGDVSKVQEQVFAQSLLAPGKNAKGGLRMLANKAGDRAITDEVKELVSLAKQNKLPGENRLWLMSPWLTTDEGVQELLDAKRLNPSLDLQIAIPGREARRNKFMVRLSRTHYEDLINAGIKVTEQPMMAHAKVVLGGNRLVVSSMNLSHGSKFMDHELGVAIDDAKIASEMVDHFRYDFARGKQLTLSDVRGPSTQIFRALRQLTRFRF